MADSSEATNTASSATSVADSTASTAVSSASTVSQASSTAQSVASTATSSASSTASSATSQASVADSQASSAAAPTHLTDQEIYDLEHPKTYMAQAGEDLVSICNRFGVSYGSVANINHFRNAVRPWTNRPYQPPMLIKLRV